MFENEYMQQSRGISRQAIEEFMENYGISIRKYASFYCLWKDTSMNIDVLMDLTNYHALCRDDMIIVQNDSHEQVRAFQNYEKAFEALKYLYGVIKYTKRPEEF